ncbi:hypothetical protein [Wolbachia endosymbiont of Ctenocephalides felis wCfeT]|uniref:hypothetical protein n=1 Tax=Wolbachia endosymbiont of Ctenocephalides felis wCfeT TaxID=2732593 RepID=UPI001445B697|nr:hypothetical protein [Wolbachia endosymbiont of Ctenocephalides felis wCfeT]
MTTLSNKDIARVMCQRGIKCELSDEICDKFRNKIKKTCEKVVVDQLKEECKRDLTSQFKEIEKSVAKKCGEEYKDKVCGFGGVSCEEEEWECMAILKAELLDREIRKCEEGKSLVLGEKGKLYTKEVCIHSGVWLKKQ